ncbi:allophanate hydrolase [Neobacillus niacini]|uniref:allophanate hydrolase n=1 Tax=Neobacillus driksii TaxID=3035913 RepID=UPI0027841CF6|nr:allophanate hydrolase [Neobacillus niacini]MDQ0970193.1 allophanate hydrolase [Neobacillus niacini]
MKSINVPQLLSIPELKGKYQSKELTPEDVIQEVVLRAEAEKEYNIWITPPAMERIKPYLEKLKQMDPEQTPLWGIPFAIKDNIDLAGIPTTSGCPEFSYTPNEHATVVTRLIEAGAIPIGKANLDQFATGLVGTRSPYGETKNSLNPELISGGSSSGSAVSVARGMAAFSLGTDTAGSGRVPAALNNLVGYKPSLGAWPIKGLVKACASLDCINVFAHSLSDALLVDEVVRGFESNDPWSKSIKRNPNTLPEKICLVQEPPIFYGPFAQEYKRAWEKAVARIGKLGIPIEYIDGSYLGEASAILYEGPWVAERWSELGEFITTHENAAFPVTETVLRSGAKPQHDAASLFKAMHKLQAFKQKAHQQLKNAVLVMPTCGGTWTREQVRSNPIETNSLMGLYTNHCNLLDLSAVAVPAQAAEENLPFGITLFSSSANEHLICGLADLFLHDRCSLQKKETTFVAVCGLHMRGFPLEKQMIEHGAVFIREAKTAPQYKMIKLPSQPSKPGLIRLNEPGSSIEVEVWEMPLSQFGSFVSLIPSPLGIGRVQLEGGSEIPGFICETSAAKTAEDISHTGGWRYASAALK